MSNQKLTSDIDIKKEILRLLDFDYWDEAALLAWENGPDMVRFAFNEVYNVANGIHDFSDAMEN